LDDDDVERLLSQATPQQREQMLLLLRERYGIAIHRLENDWGTTAEVILEAIHEAPDLIQRGVRGVLAEAIFRTVVVPQTLPSWRSEPVHNDEAYDLLLSHRSPGLGRVRVQVKSQRKERQVPKIYRQQVGPPPVYVVETQRTRNGTHPDGTSSRPYRFHDFDILAVCLHASSGRWEDFIYCAAPDLLPRRTDETLLEVLQPIYFDRPGIWSRDFEMLVFNNLRTRTDGRSR
jgi:hypothetical protein